MLIATISLKTETRAVVNLLAKGHLFYPYITVKDLQIANSNIRGFPGLQS